MLLPLFLRPLCRSFDEFTARCRAAAGPATLAAPAGIVCGPWQPDERDRGNAWHHTWRDLGRELLARPVRPQLILCISAHWLTRGGWWLTGMARPRTLHDFSGFPRILFEQQYPRRGRPLWRGPWRRSCARRPRASRWALMKGGWQRVGPDHGAWSVLKPMFPAADIPVVQLSMDYARPPAEHLALGRQLAPLRERGVLIVASGNVVHNLAAMRMGTGINAAYTWASGLMRA